MANEKLQQHFIQNVFKQEQEIYEREAIKFPNVQYRDNQPCLDVLETKGTGIFAILDEECKLPKGTDRAFTGKVHISHEQSACCRKPKMGRNCKLTETEAFVIRHFAGEVTYVTEDFLDKNNDALHNDVEGCIRSSSIELVSSLGEEKKRHKGRPEETSKCRRTVFGATPKSPRRPGCHSPELHPLHKIEFSLET
eukprot:Rmarinus@m.18601